MDGPALPKPTGAAACPGAGVPPSGVPHSNIDGVCAGRAGVLLPEAPAPPADKPSRRLLLPAGSAKSSSVFECASCVSFSSLLAVL
eukprot:scaffold8760_cov116-Isochrysis_galbana.AAC.10